MFGVIVFLSSFAFYLFAFDLVAVVFFTCFRRRLSAAGILFAGCTCVSVYVRDRVLTVVGTISYKLLAGIFAIFTTRGHLRQR